MRGDCLVTHHLQHDCPSIILRKVALVRFNIHLDLSLALRFSRCR